MLKKAAISWTVKQLCKMIDKGTIKFDNLYQRNYVWDNKRKHLFIDSLIQGYPVPAMFAKKDNDGVYDMLDGLQRCNCVHEYINDGFALGALPNITDEDGKDVIVTNKKFSDLPETIQDSILSYMFTIYYFDGITDEEVKEMFYRLNNNLPLTTFELLRTKALSFNEFKKLAEHEVYNLILGKKEISHSVNEDMAMKTWIMLKEEEPCLDKKNVSDISTSEEITEEYMDKINKLNDYMLELYNIVLTNDNPNIKKIAKKFFTKTQYLSLIPLTNDIMENKITISKEEYANWIIHFFDTYEGEDTKKTSISDVYNENLSGSAHASSIANRVKAIIDDFNNFVK